MTNEELTALDQFVNTWTCERGGRHRVYRFCDCPGMGIDVKALKRGLLRVAPTAKARRR